MIIDSATTPVAMPWDPSFERIATPELLRTSTRKWFGSRPIYPQIETPYYYGYSGPGSEE